VNEPLETYRSVNEPLETFRSVNEALETFRSVNEPIEKPQSSKSLSLIYFAYAKVVYSY